MGDTVVFVDEVDAAMDAAFTHGLSVTALHNHFFHDTPKVYYMHIGGEGQAETLAAGVKAVWGAIRAVRSTHPQPATGFGGATPTPGHVDADAVSKIVGQPATDSPGVAKITIARTGTMQGMTVSGSMGLTTWAAFSGSDALAAMDGDFIMTAEEVQPVLHALRKAGVHIVALHSHMIGEHPNFYFTHFWSTGKAEDLAHAHWRIHDRHSAKVDQSRFRKDTRQPGQSGRSHARVGEDRLARIRGPSRPDRFDAPRTRRATPLDQRRALPACAQLLHAATGS